MPRKMAPNWYGSGRSSSLPTVGTYLTTPFGRLASPGTYTRAQTYLNNICKYFRCVKGLLRDNACMSRGSQVGTLTRA